MVVIYFVRAELAGVPNLIGFDSTFRYWEYAVILTRNWLGYTRDDSLEKLDSIKVARGYYIETLDQNG